MLLGLSFHNARDSRAVHHPQSEISMRVRSLCLQAQLTLTQLLCSNQYLSIGGHAVAWWCAGSTARQCDAHFVRASTAAEHKHFQCCAYSYACYIVIERGLLQDLFSKFLPAGTVQASTKE